ncbi:MAG: hypothetical protein IBX63_00465 [Coriobacteriia bacterium]|nr:hypothetical protein [Coriobacteriia bacterium]
MLVILTACLAWAVLSWLGVGGGSHKDFFEANWAEYQRVADESIARARSAGLQNSDIQYRLAAREARLSDGGHVWVRERSGRGYWVTFFRVRGLVGSGTMLLYCSSETWTASEVAEFFDEVEPLGDGWYLTREY